MIVGGHAWLADQTRGCRIQGFLRPRNSAAPSPARRSIQPAAWHLGRAACCDRPLVGTDTANHDRSRCFRDRRSATKGKAYQLDRRSGESFRVWAWPGNVECSLCLELLGIMAWPTVSIRRLRASANGTAYV